MSTRRWIAVAVASACAWPVTAAATGVVFDEAATPHSVSESAPWLTAEETRARHTSGRHVSLPNPDTPWSVSEAGPVNYAEDMRERALHVASVEQTRVAIAREESERLAAIERERLAAIERERLLSLERERLAHAPVGGTMIDTPNAPAPLENAYGAERAPGAPGEPRERPAGAAEAAGLVDSRAGATGLSLTTESGGPDRPPRPEGDAATGFDLSGLRSEPAGAAATGPQAERALAAELRAMDTTLPSSAPAARADTAGMRPAEGEASNAYIATLKDGAAR